MMKMFFFTGPTWEACEDCFTDDKCFAGNGNNTLSEDCW